MKKKLFLLGILIILCLVAMACGEKTHVHSYGEWAVTTVATCEKAGEETRICSLDNTHKEIRIVEAKGHSYGEWAVTTAPTCDKAGEETRVCSLDNTHKETQPVTALGHNYGAWTVTTKVTCEKAGEETRICSSDISHTESKIITALGHSYGEWAVTTVATCDKAGEETRVCSLDNTHKETRIVEAKGHSYDEWTVTTVATCDKAGEETRICSLDNTHTETQPVTALGHSYDEWTVTTTPTCDKAGEETRVCASDISHTESKIITALGHNYGEWEITTPPTTTEVGEETRICKHDSLHIETKQVEKLPIIAEIINVINGNSITVTDKVNATLQLDIHIKYIGESSKTATSADVTFTSTNHLVATVDANGLITIIAPGTVEIYVDSVYNNESGVKVRQIIILTVKHSPITELNLLTRNNYSMIRGLKNTVQAITDDTAQIGLTIRYYEFALRTATNADLTFTSNNHLVATVDENGLISFKGLGTCTITITSKHEKQEGGYMEKTVDIEVKKPVNDTGLEVISFEAGMEGTRPLLEYTIKNMSDNEVTFRIVDVHYLDSSGKVLKTGTLLVGDMIPITLLAGQTISDAIAGGSNLPEGVKDIAIFNKRNA